MGARIDDSSKKMWSNLKSHPNERHSDYSLITKLVWSKNIFEERDPPQQILLGACHNHFCVILGLASWLEYWIGKGHHERTKFLFGLEGEDDPDIIKRRASTALKKILGEDDTFDDVIELFTDLQRKLGTHSMRKFAATFAAENGIPNDFIDIRYVLYCCYIVTMTLAAALKH